MNHACTNFAAIFINTLKKQNFKNNPAFHFVLKMYRLPGPRVAQNKSGPPGSRASHSPSRRPPPLPGQSAFFFFRDLSILI